MNTEYTTIDYDEDILKNRRLWYVLGFSLLLLSLIFRQALLFLFAMFTLLIALVPNLWYRTALRHLVIRQRVSQHRLFFGE